MSPTTEMRIRNPRLPRLYARRWRDGREFFGGRVPYRFLGLQAMKDNGRGTKVFFTQFRTFPFLNRRSFE